MRFADCCKDVVLIAIGFGLYFCYGITKVNPFCCQIHNTTVQRAEYAIKPQRYGFCMYLSGWSPATCCDTQFGYEKTFFFIVTYEPVHLAL